MLTYSLALISAPGLPPAIRMVVSDEQLVVLALVEMQLSGCTPQVAAMELVRASDAAAAARGADLTAWRGAWQVQASWPLPVLPPDSLCGALRAALAALRTARDQGRPAGALAAE